jgi:hypothetical protein
MFRYTPANKTRTSDIDLCGVVDWWEGVYEQPWAMVMNDTRGVVSRTSPGRYIRSNFENFIQITDSTCD